MMYGFLILFAVQISGGKSISSLAVNAEGIQRRRSQFMRTAPRKSRSLADPLFKYPTDESSGERAHRIKFTWMVA